MTAMPRRARLSHALLVGTFLLAGAREMCAQAAPAVPTPRDTTAAAVVQAYVRAYNAHDVDAVLSFLAPDFVWLSASGDSLTVEARGRAMVRTQLTGYFRGLPSARSELETLTVLGPWVSAKERAHWTGSAGPRSQAALSVYEVRGGLIQRVWYYPSVRQAGTLASSTKYR
jgi:hypothetical protein